MRSTLAISSPALLEHVQIKLFVGNIPKSCSEEQLLPFFEALGRVVELVIVRDKVARFGYLEPTS